MNECFPIVLPGMRPKYPTRTSIQKHNNQWSGDTQLQRNRKSVSNLHTQFEKLATIFSYEKDFLLVDLLTADVYCETLDKLKYPPIALKWYSVQSSPCSSSSTWNSSSLNETNGELKNAVITLTLRRRASLQRR